ncbi:MAG: tagatose-bisphosphate aldolase [Rhodobacteraceae bacterium]|nr:tagatose-bisphosphate aldolase [Paracoccaceae bacterium]
MTAHTDILPWATWRETLSQPDIWRQWATECPFQELRNWITKQRFDEIWFCGAGTSAFIGDILVAGLEGRATPPLRAVPTTDIVARPRDYLSDRKTPLVVNFGRSGNSAETLGILDALDKLAPNAPQLNITCNPKGALALRGNHANHRLVLLPQETHDSGFAMTASFSTMLLTAVGIFDDGAVLEELLPSLAQEFDRLLPTFCDLAHARPERIVYVGSGPLAFAAREAALKTLELSAGQIPALWDSTLGFRHGPKSFVQPDTQIIVFLGSHPQAKLYDADLVEELREQFPNNPIVSLGPSGDIDTPSYQRDLWTVPLAVGLAQVVSIHWSHQLGLNVDDPFAGQGTLSRVVSNVRIHEVAQ